MHINGTCPKQQTHEKCYFTSASSRLNGCYEALEGGNTTEALVDFTGGVSEPLSLDRAALGLNGDQRRALFQTLAKAHECKALITCSIRVGRSSCVP